jgi:hypothetical protein
VAHFLNDYLAELAAAAPREAAWVERVEGQELPLLSMTPAPGMQPAGPTMTETEISTSI